MKCPVCLSQIPNDSVFCTNCGTRIPVESNPQPAQTPQFTYSSPQQPQPQQYYQSRVDDAGCLAILISFLQPFIGFALYLVWKEYRPNSAKTCLITAIVALVLSVFSGIVLGIIGAVSSVAKPSYMDSIGHIINLIKS